MNQIEKKPYVPSPNVSHPDMSLVRKFRIEKFEWLLAKAEAEENFGLEKKFKKELEIQKAYLKIGQ